LRSLRAHPSQALQHKLALTKANESLETQLAQARSQLAHLHSETERLAKQHSLEQQRLDEQLSAAKLQVQELNAQLAQQAPKLDELETLQQQLQVAREEAQSKEHSFTQTLTETKDQLSRARAECEALTQKRHDEQQALDEQLRQSNAAIEEREEQLALLRTELSALRAQHELSLAEAAELSAHRQELVLQREQLQLQLQSQTQLTTALEAQHNETLAAHAQDRQLCERAREELAQQQQSNADLRDKLAATEQQERLLNSRVQGLVQDLALAHRAAESLRQQAAAQSSPSAEKARVERLRRELKAQRSELERLQDAIALKNVEVAAHRERILELEELLQHERDKALQARREQESTPAFAAPHPLLAEIIELKATLIDLRQEYAQQATKHARELESLRSDNAALQDAIAQTELEIETQLEHKAQLCSALDSAMKENQELRRKLEPNAGRNGATAGACPRSC
jgi:chromosome segregation ATPase